MQFLMNLPFVSVVMSVRNVGDRVKDTIASIQQQENVAFEFLIVNDGSTDGTLDVLKKIQQTDPRIRILDCAPRGLTKALIEACQLARGDFIARQDAYDYSTQERLLTQASALAANPRATMISSHVRFITQERETVFISSPKAWELSKDLKGVIHGSVMFRKSDYLRVGGYRSEFYYAQDVDLWSRLIEIGDHIFVSDILYENCLFPGSISGSRKREQTKLHRLILQASEARQLGHDEARWLNKAAAFSEKCQHQKTNKKDLGKGSYFIAACLIETNPELAKKYLELTLENDPFHLRARLRLLKLGQ
jgi:glycosyltransferase involved in cell wall biosynthesis